MAYPYSQDYEAQRKEKELKSVVLKTNRSMWKLMLFSILTLGIYSIIFFIGFSFELEKAHPARERSKPMNYLFAYILAFFTMSIVIDIWHYQIAAYMEEALEERNIDYSFGTTDFWVWFLLGSLFLVGPFIYFHKLCRAMNLLCENYNARNNA